MLESYSTSHKACQLWAWGPQIDGGRGWDVVGLGMFSSQLCLLYLKQIHKLLGYSDGQNLKKKHVKRSKTHD